MATMNADEAPKTFASLFDRLKTDLHFDYPLHVRILEKGDPTPLDMDAHQGFEVNLVLEGRFERYLEDMVMVAGEGDVSLVGPWEPHAWRVVSPGTTAIALIFLPEVVTECNLGDLPWLNMFTVLPSQRPRVANAALRQTVLAIGQEVLREATDKRSGWLIAVRLCLLRLLFALSREWTPPKLPPLQRRERSAELQKLTPAVNLVHEHPFDHITQERAAAACGLRPSQFGRLFHATIGMTFVKFRLRARMAAVAYRLLYTHKSVGAIAEETGFVDSSHLHHTFQKYYGVTPGRFRELRG